jgi:hypothetical protein
MKTSRQPEHASGQILLRRRNAYTRGIRQASRRAARACGEGGGEVLHSDWSKEHPVKLV